MKKFFKNGIIFLVFFLIISEVIARVFHISSDAPRTYKNESGYIRLHPNQEGYWNGGQHKWYVNKLGYPGKNLPASYTNLYTIIGDSYIANFMNPDSCRQTSYLRETSTENNFLELSRSGANLLDYLSYVEDVEHLNPKLNFLYVNTKDFKHSIKKKKISGGLEVDLLNNQIYYPIYQGSALKDLIYNFKFLYYVYRKNMKLAISKNQRANNSNLYKNSLAPNEEANIEKLLDFISKNYKLNKIVFVCHPDLNVEILRILKNKNIQTISLKLPNNDEWKLKDGHWSCYGHKYMSQQVRAFIEQYNSKTKITL